MRRRIALPLALALSACAAGGQGEVAKPPVAMAPAPPPRARVTPDAPFRAQPPEPEPAAPFYPPAIAAFTLSNGLRVLLVEVHDRSLVSFELVTRPRDGELFHARPGVRGLMARLLRSGTTTRSEHQLSTAIDRAFASLGSGASLDSSYLQAKCVSEKFDEVLAVMSDIALHPKLDPASLEREKAVASAERALEPNRPTLVLDRVFSAATYGAAHPYSEPARGRPDLLATVTIDEVRRAYEEEMTPATAALVIVGDVEKATLVPKLEHAFASWKGRPSAAPVTPPAAPSPSASRIVVVGRPGAAHARVLFGGLAVPRGDASWRALMALNRILGGSTQSRLGRTLYQDLGYSYNGSTSLSWRRGTGTFAWEGDVREDKTADALAELERQMRRMTREEVSPEELADAKEALLASTPGAFATVDGIASAVAAIPLFDLPLDEYATQGGRDAALRAEDLLRVAQKVLVPERMKAIIVGDWGKMRSSVLALGWGPVEVRDAWGNVLRTETR